MDYLEHWFDSLPPIIPRCQVGKLTNGVVSPRTLANHDSALTGPEDRFLVNGKVAYSRESFIAWLSERSRILRTLGDVDHAEGQADVK